MTTDPAQVQGVQVPLVVVSRLTRLAGVDHGRHAGDGQRGLGDVGRHDDARLVGGRREGALLGLGAFGTAQFEHAIAHRAADGLQRLGRSPDLADARHEDKDRAVEAVGEQVAESPYRLVPDGLLWLGRLIGDVDRVRLGVDFDEGGGVEKGREGVAFEGGRHDDQREVRPGGALQPAEPREAGVGFEGALVELVEDDERGPRERRVLEQLLPEDAVGHEEEAGGVLTGLLEAHLIAHRLADALAALGGYPHGQVARRDAAGLEDDGGAVLGQEDLRRLGRLAGAGGRREDQATMVSDRIADGVGVGEDGKLGQRTHCGLIDGAPKRKRIILETPSSGGSSVGASASL
ncbi:hypothetical protein D3C86_1013780 [compost metagenome]